MSLSSHLEELETKHRKLDHELAQERKSYASSEETLSKLKKEKLLLKDRISMLKVNSES